TQLLSSTDADEALLSANTRGQQLLAANDIITVNPADPRDPNQECPVLCTDEPGYPDCLDLGDQADADKYEAFWETYDYCGRQSQGDMFGSVRYHVEARWHSEVFFMRLLGFDSLPI